MGKLVQVNTTTITSPTVNVTLTGIDSDDVYMVAYNNLTTNSDDCGVALQFTHSGTPQTTSVYDSVDKKLRADTTFENRSITNQSWIRLDQFLGTGTSEKGNGIIYLYNMNSTTEYAYCTFEVVTYNYVPFASGGQGGGVFKNTGTARDGINFTSQSGTQSFSAGTITLYKVL